MNAMGGKRQGKEIQMKKVKTIKMYRNPNHLSIDQREKRKNK